jgi:hypothetical protein
MYCSDSLAGDVEHYKPISVDYTVAFSWENLLWVCATCNRKKSSRFPVKDGEPLIINPASEDPWRFLFLDLSSGVLAPRFDEDSPSEKGAATLQAVDILNHEGVIESRARYIRRLKGFAKELLQCDASNAVASKFISEILHNDFGVASYVVLWDGAFESPFSDVRAGFPRLWRRLIRAACR